MNVKTSGNKRPGNAADVHQTVTYDAVKLVWFQVGLAAALIAVSLLMLSDGRARYQPIAWAMLVAGSAWGLFQLGRTLFPGPPMLELSPKGLRLRTAGKNLFVPWQEVHGVDSTTITMPMGQGLNRDIVYPRITVVLVSRSFFDRAIGNSALMLAKQALFVPKGSMMQIALHHDAMSVPLKELRPAVEARWRAFGDPRRTGRAQREAEAASS